jgi:hypothetical protein
VFSAPAIKIIYPDGSCLECQFGTAAQRPGWAPGRRLTSGAVWVLSSGRAAGRSGEPGDRRPPPARSLRQLCGCTAKSPFAPGEGRQRRRRNPERGRYEREGYSPREDPYEPHLIGYNAVPAAKVAGCTSSVQSLNPHVPQLVGVGDQTQAGDPAA